MNMFQCESAVLILCTGGTQLLSLLYFSHGTARGITVSSTKSKADSVHKYKF